MKGHGRRGDLMSAVFVFIAALALCLARAASAGSEMGLVTGGIVDQFHRDDPNGNMELLKDALEEEVRQRRLSIGAITPILNHMVPWITHLRDLRGDPQSLRAGLSLDPETVSARDIETLARVLNLPPAPSEAPVLAPSAAPKPVARKLARSIDRDADRSFDAFGATLTPAPQSAPTEDRGGWSASGAPRHRP